MKVEVTFDLATEKNREHELCILHDLVTKIQALSKEHAPNRVTVEFEDGEQFIYENGERTLSKMRV